MEERRARMEVSPLVRVDKAKVEVEQFPGDSVESLVGPVDRRTQPDRMCHCHRRPEAYVLHTLRVPSRLLPPEGPPEHEKQCLDHSGLEVGRELSFPLDFD